MDVSTAVSPPNVPLIPPLLGFECFVWPEATGEPVGDPSFQRNSRDGSRWGFRVLLMIYCRCRCLRFSVTPRKDWGSEVQPPPRGRELYETILNYLELLV